MNCAPGAGGGARTGGVGPVRFVLVSVLSVMAVVITWLVFGRAETPSNAGPAGRQVSTLVAVDSSGGGHDGIIQGPVVFGLPGFDGTAYSFENSGAWVQVASAAALNPDEYDFLFSAWVNLEESPGRSETYDVIRKGISFTSPGEFKLEVLPLGRVRCTAKDQYQRVVTATSTKARVVDGDWHRVGCARTGSMWSVIVDETITSRVVALGSVGNTVALSIGSKYGFEDRPAGRLDDVKLIIDRSAVSGEELEEPELTARIRDLEEQPPAGWWRLDEAATTVAGR